MITLEKIDKNYYAVLSDDKRIGDIIKERAKGSQTSKRYLGYVAPYMRWAYTPDDPESRCYFIDDCKVNELVSKLQERLNK